MVGQKFGKLTALEEFKIKNSNGRIRYMVRCVCDCGNETAVEKSHLKSGQTSSCGCIQKETRASLGKKFRKPEGVSAFNELYGAYKKSAKQRGYDFELTKDEFKELITQPCIYCGQEASQALRKHNPRYQSVFYYTGIDRYDNTKGYTKENCVPCCKVCNRLKTDMSIQEFKDKISLVLSRSGLWDHREES